MCVVWELRGRAHLPSWKENCYELEGQTGKTRLLGKSHSPRAARFVLQPIDAPRRTIVCSSPSDVQ